MKKLFLITTFTILGLITNAQTTLKGCMGINFRDTKEQVKKVMSSKDFEFYREDDKGVLYTGGTFAGYGCVGAIFRFHKNQLHTIDVLLDIKQEPKATELYYQVLEELKDKYGVIYTKRHNYRSPYFAGDGYTVSGIKMGYIDMQSVFMFDDGNALAVEITKEISLKITYQDSELIDEAIAVEAAKKQQGLLIMNSIDTQYQALLHHIKLTGTKKQTRNGSVISTFGRQIRHNMAEGFPLLTTKKMYWKGIVTELLWFLRGDTNIKFLHDNDCHIWDGDYAKSGRTDGELGPIYGKQWRRWGAGHIEDKHGFGNIDQITNLINEIKTNPDSRRLMVNAWNVGELDQMVLPPCHYGFQCYVKEGKYLSLLWNQRSVDTFLGLPFNIASYGLLLHILAKATNMIPDQLIGNLGDVHIYSEHIDAVNEQLKRTPLPLPTLKFNPIFLANLEHKGLDAAINGQVDFQLENYESHPNIKAPLIN